MISDGVADELPDGVEAKFAHDGGPVGFRGFNADAEVGGNLLVAFAFGKELDDFALAVGGFGGVRVSRGGLCVWHALAAEALEQNLGNLRAEVMPSREDGFDGRCEVSASVGFENVAMRAGLNNLVNQAFGIMDRKNQNFGFGAELEDLAGSIDAV